MTLTCHSYKTIGVCCKAGGALSKPFSRVFGVNPMRRWWLRRIVHRNEWSGTLIAYWNSDPQSFTEKGGSLRVSPDRHEQAFSSSYSRHNPIPDLLPKPPAHPGRWPFLRLASESVSINFHLFLNSF